DFDSTFLPQRCVRKYTNRPKSDINSSDDSEIEANQPSESSEFTTEEDEITSESDDGESDDNGDFETFEDYASPNYEPFRDSSKSATEALIKFIKLVLTEIRGNDFKDFPNLMFLTKKTLGIKDRFQYFVP
ncbi:10316_t:CDS:2, partial [Funneliformis geosporum]